MSQKSKNSRSSHPEFISGSVFQESGILKQVQDDFLDILKSINPEVYENRRRIVSRCCF